MDDVFKALSDPTRRKILDLLRVRDGRTVSDLETQIDLTRFGVMKHLKVLEEAHLVTTRKAGRFKHVYLNAVPLQQIADRWIARYVEPAARFAVDLKTQLEDTPMSDRPSFVTEIFIKTTPERLWQALTSPKETPAYYFGSAVRSDWSVGAPLQYVLPDGRVMVDGEVLEIDPPRKLVSTFVPRFREGAAPSRVAFEIEPMGEVCKLTLTHWGLGEADGDIHTGWAKILNSLKSLLETGEALRFPAA